MLSAILLMRIRKQEPRLVASGERSSMKAEILTGLRYTLRHPLLRPLVIQIGIGNFFLASVSSILLVYAVRNLHLSPETIGLTFSIGNLGLRAGATIARRMAHGFGIGPTLIIGATGTGLAYL